MKAIFVIPNNAVLDKVEFLWKLNDIGSDQVEHVRYANGGYPFNENQHFSYKAYEKRFVIVVEGERCALKDLITPRLLEAFDTCALDPQAEDWSPVVYETQVEDMLWHEDMCDYVKRVGPSDAYVKQGALEALGACVFDEDGVGELRYIYGETVNLGMPRWKIEAAKLIWDKMSWEQKKAQRELVEFYRSL